jgi:sec-independent protein translocase protein TatA
MTKQQRGLHRRKLAGSLMPLVAHCLASGDLKGRIANVWKTAQPMHLLIIIGLALLILGPKKLPELVKGLGDGLRSLKAAMSCKEQTVESNNAETPKKMTIGSKNEIPFER